MLKEEISCSVILSRIYVLRYSLSRGDCRESFSCKGMVSFSSLNVHKMAVCAQGGVSSGSESGGQALTSLGGNGSATGCSTNTPRV